MAHTHQWLNFGTGLRSVRVVLGLLGLLELLELLELLGRKYFGRAEVFD